MENNISGDSNKSQQSTKVFMIKEEPVSTLSTIWESITSFFKEDDIVEAKVVEPKDSTDIKICKCPKTKNRNYCDNIYEILQMTKRKYNIDKRSKELYQSLLEKNDFTLGANKNNISQIKKDTIRTYSSTTNFIQKDKILEKLEKVLKAFSNYDNKIKYCQGMNFIVAFFLYHCEEHIAFWLFICLIEEYDLRSLFYQDFPGLNLHVKRFKEILINEYPSYWTKFEQIGVKVDIFMIEWILSLFSSLIPLDLQMDFYKGFFSQGWIFFYKMCISCILNLEGEFKLPDEIYIALKKGKNEDVTKEEEIKNIWNNIIKRAYSIKIKTDVMKIKDSD